MSSFDNDLAEFRKSFASYVLVEVQPVAGAPARLFALQPKDGGSMNAVTLLFVAPEKGMDQIVVAGDLCPSGNGCISATGYGVGWFSRPQSHDYLCGKFLRKEWVPEAAVAWMVEHLSTEEADAIDPALDEEERATVAERARRMKEAIEQGLEETGDDEDPTRGPEAFSEWYSEVFEDGPEEIGFAYNPHDAALLIVIQETFARLYSAAPGGGS